MIETLKTLCTLSGPSGFEGSVREYIREQAAPYADQIREDGSGSLLVFKKGRTHLKQTVMLCAHMDEVGVMARAADENGFIRFGFLGGIDARVVLGKQVFFGESRVPGVIGCKPIHLTDEGERKHAAKVKELYIDIGASSREEAERLVPPGTWGVFFDDLQTMPNHFIKAKALDDRIGCAVMLALLREELPVDTWFAFTVQEEVGCRGAFGSAFSIQPQIALALEGTTAADTPLCSGAGRVCECGKGPTISFMDGASIADTRLYAQLCALADANQIPWQTKTRVAGGNDAGSVQRAVGGCRTCVISVPVRYLHSASSLACLWDVVNARQLVEKFLLDLEVQNDA
jgi:endoglucanase